MTSFSCDATVMFCDIRNFTVLFEKKDPIKAIAFANEVLAVLGKEVENNNGVVDRFTGDGFLAHFGLNQSDLNHAEMACRSVIGLRTKLSNINSERYLREESVLNIGVGIHSGIVAVGDITTGNITQRTILGDTVNTASRIESLTKYFSVDALISESTKDRLKGDLKLQKMPLKELKGKKRNVQTYWLLPMN
ncbi:adenylate/guanylate cyclase domain-containing protein [Rhodohalobacter sp. 8-1]|uniref:adenylate/guanylate cyclase domain-containing protein n=1 Tax=Rhodohalobacter sp. 8-1 TaxID=3131972 RepID=UPI0030EEB4BB